MRKHETRFGFACGGTRIEHSAATAHVGKEHQQQGQAAR